MLNDELIEKVNERLIRRIEQANEYVIGEIAKSIKRIRDVSPTNRNKLINILKTGGDYDKIVNRISKITKINKKEIKEIFESVAKNDYEFSKQFYDYRKVKYIPYEKNLELKSMVNSIANITANEYTNISRSTNIGLGIVNKDHNIEFKTLKTAYNELIDEALINISSGKETFDSVMKRSLKELGNGLRVIYPTTYVDKNGEIKHHTRRLDSALRQQMNDGLRTLHNEMQQEIGKKFDSDGVEITVHLNPAPDHMEVQGRQFSNEEFDNFQNDTKATSYDGKVFEPEYEGHDRRSISQYNCYHYTFAIVLGVNKPQYNDEQLKKIIDDNNKGFKYEGKTYTMYEGTQMQRQLETAIRDSKYQQIVARESDNVDLIRESQHRITILNNKYKKLCSASGLPSKANRMSVSGYKRVRT